MLRKIESLFFLHSFEVFLQLVWLLAPLLSISGHVYQSHIGEYLASAICFEQVGITLDPNLDTWNLLSLLVSDEFLQLFFS